MSKYVTVSTTNTWDTKYVTWARKDTVTSYCTKYTLCNGGNNFSLKVANFADSSPRLPQKLILPFEVAVAKIAKWTYLAVGAG